MRSDWFDLCGPFKYPNRRRFARISAENPLPQLFQDILEKKLVLIQKLDPNCDLYQAGERFSDMVRTNFVKEHSMRAVAVLVEFVTSLNKDYITCAYVCMYVCMLFFLKGVLLLLLWPLD